MEPTTIATSMTTALEPIRTQALEVLAAVAVIGIGIGGAFLLWKLGMKFFKGLAK